MPLRVGFDFSTLLIIDLTSLIYSCFIIDDKILKIQTNIRTKIDISLHAAG